MSGEAIAFVVRAVPLAQPRQRIRVVHGGGKKKPFAMGYTAKLDPVNAYKAAVSKAASHAMSGRDLAPQPLAFDILYVLARPKNHYGTGKNAGQIKDSAPDFVAIKPDLDNLDKSTLDAMKGIMFVDDAEVCGGQRLKRYVRPGESPMVVISRYPTEWAEAAWAERLANKANM